MPRKPIHDAVNDETFSRVVGQRRRAPLGAVPSREARDAMVQMAAYCTAAPKGVYRYHSHEEANRDRDRWVVLRAVACQAAASKTSRGPK